MRASPKVMLERPVLRAKLEAALREHRLVFVQAPPGYGKSTAISDALAYVRQTVVRYDAAPWDVESFIEPLVAAVRTSRPEFGRRALALAEAGADPGRIGSAFAADLGHLSLETLIVVEDAHLLGAGFGAFIDGLFRDPPDTVTWLLSSRRPAQFSLANLLLRDLVAVFSSDDLRFDRADLEALAAHFGSDVASERLDELARRTEGWPAGVVLSLRTDCAPVAITGGSYEAAAAFLVEQLLDTFAADELVAVEQMAVYDVIDDRIVDAAPDPPATREALNRLEQRGAMIARLADGAIRVHPMLRDVIVQRVARRSGSATIGHLHACAARLYAEIGNVAAALFHLEATNEVGATHDILLRHGTEAIERGHGERVARLAARLNAAGHMDPGLVAYLDGWRAKQRGDDRARERFAGAASHGGPLAFSAQVEMIEHDLAHGRAVSQADIDGLRATADTFGATARAAAEIRAGWHAALNGRFGDALRSADDAMKVDMPMLRQSAAPLRAYALTVLGRFAEAEHELAALLERLHDTDSLGLRSRMLVWSARLALLRGDTRGAFADAAEARRTGTGLIAPSEMAALYVALAESATHIGDAATAGEAVAGVVESAEAAWYEHDRKRFPALASLHGARGIFLREGAPAALRAAERGMQHEVPPVQRAMLLTDATWYAHLAGDTAAARLAEACSAVASATPADAADAAGLNAAAGGLAALRGRAGLQAPAPAVSFGAFTALAAGLDELERRGPRFETRLVAWAERATADTVDPVTQKEQLTRREAEILELLALGLTNKEIAQRLVLGTRTVETHVARILGKLGVNSRSRAIAAHIRKSTDAPAGAQLL